MRKMTAQLNGKSLPLVANFAAATEVADNVGDPLQIARETVLESMLLEQGIPYTPRWEFTIKNVTELLRIAVRAGGTEMSDEELQDAVFTIGFVEAKKLAGDYLTLIVGPKPEEIIKGEGSAEGKD